MAKKAKVVSGKGKCVFTKQLRDKNYKSNTKVFKEGVLKEAVTYLLESKLMEVEVSDANKLGNRTVNVYVR